MPTLSKHTENVVASINNNIIANSGIEKKYIELKDIRAKIKSLSSIEKKLQDSIKAFMSDEEVLLNKKGDILVTYKQSDDVEKLDAKKLQELYEDVYKACLVLAAGSRRFLVK